MAALPFESPEFTALLDDAQAWLCMAATLAAAMGATLAQGIVAMLPRVASGYMPKAQRNAVAHGLYKLGVRTGPKRETVAQRTARESRILGLAS